MSFPQNTQRKLQQHYEKNFSTNTHVHVSKYIQKRRHGHWSFYGIEQLRSKYHIEIKQITRGTSLVLLL